MVLLHELFEFLLQAGLSRLKETQDMEKSVRIIDATAGSARVYYYPFALVLRLRVLQVSE